MAQQKSPHRTFARFHIRGVQNVTPFGARLALAAHELGDGPVQTVADRLGVDQENLRYMMQGHLTWPYAIRRKLKLIYGIDPPKAQRRKVGFLGQDKRHRR